MSKQQTEVEESRPIEKKQRKFSFIEPIAGIIFAVVATIIFLGFPQIITIVFIGGRLIPTFDAEVIRSLWLPIILWAVVRIGVDVAYLVQQRYTQSLAIISLIGNALTAILTFIIFINSRIVYWEYVDFVHRYYEEIAAWFGAIIARPNIIILVVILLVLVLDTFNAIRKGGLMRKTDEDDEDDDEENKSDESKTEESANVEDKTEENAEKVT